MKKPNRTKTPITITFRPEVLARLDGWIAAQEFNLHRNDVVEAAIENYLDQKERATNAAAIRSALEGGE